MSCLRHTSFKQEIRHNTHDYGLECVWHSHVAATAAATVFVVLIVIARIEHIGG